MQQRVPIVVHIKGPGDVRNLSSLVQSILCGATGPEDCPVSVAVTDWLPGGIAQPVEVPTDYTDILQRGWDQLDPMLQEMAAGNLETGANNFTAGVSFVPFQGANNV
jgi:hypothetical protein